jgi:hypothetical protein
LRPSCGGRSVQITAHGLEKAVKFRKRPCFTLMPHLQPINHGGRFSPIGGI